MTADATDAVTMDRTYSVEITAQLTKCVYQKLHSGQKKTVSQGSHMNQYPVHQRRPHQQKMECEEEKVKAIIEVSL